jgi:hypothetical protein
MDDPTGRGTEYVLKTQAAVCVIDTGERLGENAPDDRSRGPDGAAGATTKVRTTPISASDKRLCSPQSIIEVEMLLEETTSVRVSPEELYRFFERMDANYERWHPGHIEFSWVGGDRLEEGANASFEERIAGTTQKKTVRFTAVVPGRYIEFKPTSLLGGLLLPSISFAIDPTEDGCEFTQRIKVRTGPIGARLNRREFDAVREHMREEGENLKTILETEVHSNR